MHPLVNQQLHCPVGKWEARRRIANEDIPTPLGKGLELSRENRLRLLETIRIELQQPKPIPVHSFVSADARAVRFTAQKEATILRVADCPVSVIAGAPICPL